jgi:starch-binding outer membrane protein, SusD/RagB family
MKSSLKYLIPVLLFFVILTSCNKDLLEPVPKTSISDLTAFETPDRILGQVNGMYAALKNGTYLGGRYIVYNEIRGNNFINLTANGVTGLLTWNFTLSGDSNEVNNLWNQAYATINRINIFIEGLDASRDNPATSGIITDAQYQQYKGEALTLRALVYSHLLQLYAQPYNKDNGQSPGLPLRLKGNSTPADNDLARSTVAEVYTQIIADLNAAEAGLMLAHATPLLNVTRVHRNTAIALKTRMYLQMSNFSAVKTEAAKIVGANFSALTGVPHALVPEIQNVFAPPYTTVESILSMPFTATNLPGTQNGLSHYFSPLPRGNEDYKLNPDGIAGNIEGWPLTDSRRELLASVTRSNNDVDLFLNKYPLSPHTDYVPVIRYAEVLLNYAEAVAETDGVVTLAVDLLNTVRGRSDATVTYSISDFANKNALVNAIMLERNVEFLGEGLSNMDIIRKVAPFPAKGQVGEIPPSSDRYLWPIPISELINNNLMVDN